MKEIEVKILNVGHKDLEEKIFSLGGKKIFEGELDAYFLENSEGHIIRVRQEVDNVYITHKDTIEHNGIKEAIETEFEAKSLVDILKTFEKIGFKITSNSKKKRISYKLDKARLDFDKYSIIDNLDIPEFLEIEGQNKEDVYNVSTMLGFKNSDLKTFGIKGLIDYYK